jgi:tetratricopeptide (TPR) repeat protein
MRLCPLVAALILSGSVVHAQTSSEERDFRARQLYEVGRKAYGDADYQKAYDSFKEAFTLSHKAALLYNVASALQQLKRPHDAAETLRSYLRLRPEDTERPQIEERIRALEEEQRLLDIDRARQLDKAVKEKQPRTLPPTETPVLTPPSSEPPPSVTTTTTSDDERRRRHKRNVAIGVTVGSIVVVGLGVGLGLGLGLQGSSEALTKSTVGPLPGTR